VKGETGLAGAAGPKGEAGREGAAGEPGPPGPIGPLTKGNEETGTWAAIGAVELAPISFTLPLEEELEASNALYISQTEVEKHEVPHGCSGTAEKPNAENGFLCVFEGGFVTGEQEAVAILKSSASFAPGADQTGALVFIAAKSAESHFTGTWAVRAG
jgi:hypothetical protein